MKKKKRRCFISFFLMILSCAVLISLNGGQVCASDDCENGNHVFLTEIADATDSEPGSITYICEICGYTYSEEIAPYGHQFYEEMTDPDCDNPGRIIYTCASCGYSYEESYGAPLGHDFFMAEEMEATKTSEGRRVMRCSRCGAEYLEILPIIEKDEDVRQTAVEEPSFEGTPEEEAPEEKRSTQSISEPSTMTASPSKIIPSGGTDRKESTIESPAFAALNIGDFMLGSLELLLLVAFLPGIFICRRIIKWNERRSDEYRRHHRRWRETP